MKAIHLVRNCHSKCFMIVMLTLQAHDKASLKCLIIDISHDKTVTALHWRVAYNVSCWQHFFFWAFVDSGSPCMQECRCKHIAKPNRHLSTQLICMFLLLAFESSFITPVYSKRGTAWACYTLSFLYFYTICGPCFGNISARFFILNIFVYILRCFILYFTLYGNDDMHGL